MVEVFGGRSLNMPGYDQIIIQGKAEKPVYLWIDGDKVEIRDASHLWGKDTFETNKLILKEFGDPKIKVISIGPAGENLVKFANVRKGRTAACW